MAAERMALAANALPALVAYLDTSVRYVWVNDTYARWFGRTREEIMGRHASEVMDPAAWAVVKPYAERALAGEEVAFENARVLSDGAIRDVRASYVPHRDDGGRICGFVALVTDTTETKAVERALRRSERLLKRSQMAAHVGSWEVTFDEKFQEVAGSFFWSSETYRIFGIEPSTPATLALFYSRVHTDERGAMQARRQPNLVRAESYESEYRIVRPDGSVRLLHSWLDFDPGPDGSMHVFGTCQDITERKRAEMEIQRAREQLQLVVDTTPAFIARYDRDRRLVWANKSYAARYGKTPDELVGSPVVDLIGEAAFQAIDPISARVLAGESIQVEIELPYLDGPRWVHMAAAPTRDAAGIPDGSVAVLTDVTDGRRLAQERERALNDLREADRRKDEFLAMLSHELRNPLGPILNAVEVLDLLAPAGQDRSAPMRAVISRQAKHMKRLLDDLLDVARVSQGKIQLQKQRIDLKVLLGQAVEVNRPMVIEKRHELSILLASQPIELQADPTRLLQVSRQPAQHDAAKYTDYPGGHISDGRGLRRRRGGGDDTGRRYRDDAGPAGEGLRPVRSGDALARSRARRPGDRPHAGANAGRDARRIGARVQPGAGTREPARGEAAPDASEQRPRPQPARRRRWAPGRTRHCGCSSSTTTSTRRRCSGSS